MAAVRKGIITFGLVSIPVDLHVAARSTTLDLDLLHAKDESPIEYRLYCSREDRPVGRKEVVKGYKVDGGYVIVGKEDFEKAERATTRAIAVVQFVDQAAVDPIYLERSYFVGPQKDMERPYEVLLRALQKTAKAAVVTFVMANRQQYALLRPSGDVLVLHTLYYADEVRTFEADWSRGKPQAQEVKFAEQYIDALAQEFEPRKLHDEYRETLLAIIKAKAAGEAIEVPEVARPAAKTVNLMEALRESLEGVRKPLGKAAGRARGAELERRPTRRRRQRARPKAA
ncbi:MAG TPA: Ku protein [Methylomirabilota bacterium]|jgi:DNA end-binding protein Ku|nr:Ku protein [Methylomirabilota bacterium]